MYDDKNISKLYRYEALLQAIDFFTQKFSIKQLAVYAFDFTNEILTLNSSALFILEDDRFELTRVRNYNVTNYSIANSNELQRIATFYGNILKSNFTSYFRQEDINLFDAQLIIPLIIQDLLYGFIISNGKAVESIDEDDLIISKALMQLINNSLENSKNFSDLHDINKQLDQKIFNLFSINQSSRMLLSELDINNLYSLAIDIFSELTSSKVTSFGLYDEIENKILIKGYRNVFCSEKQLGEYELFDNNFNGYKVVYNYKNDYEELNKIFVNCKDFEKLEAEYIILIVKNKILGFVTISKPVNDRSYDESLFELIESLAASTYISFTNAIFFQEIKRQKNIIEQKLKILTKLNSLIKNINSCNDIDELCDLTIKTLNYGFRIKKALIVLKENNLYRIKQHVGFNLPDDILKTNDNWEALNTKDDYVKYIKDTDSKFFEAEFLSAVGESNCLVISPIYIDSSEVDFNFTPLGYIIVFNTPEILGEDEVLLIDTISNSIAPIINHMHSIEQVKNEYIVNAENAFLRALERKLDNKQNFLIEFYIYYKKIISKPLSKPDISAYDNYEQYYFNNYVFVLSEVELDAGIFDGMIIPENKNQVVAYIKGL